MRQDAWVVVLGRGWSPDVSGRVEAACVLPHVEPAMRQDVWVVVLGRGWSPEVSGRVEAACVLTHVEPAMRQDAWVVVLGRCWSPDMSGRVEAACVLTHVEPAMRQDAWVVVLGRCWSPDVSGRVEAACVLTHVEPAMRQDAWERKREGGGGSSQGKQMCVVTFQDNFTKLCPPQFLVHFPGYSRYDCWSAKKMWAVTSPLPGRPLSRASPVPTLPALRPTDYSPPGRCVHESETTQIWVPHSGSGYCDTALINVALLDMATKSLQGAPVSFVNFVPK